MIRINRYRADGTLYDSREVSGKLHGAMAIASADGAVPRFGRYTSLAEGDGEWYHNLQYATEPSSNAKDALRGGHMEIFIKGEE